MLGALDDSAWWAHFNSDHVSARLPVSRLHCSRALRVVRRSPPIAIRSAVCKQGQAYFHAGAGIVADSIPAAEYEETLAKAKGFFQALRLAAPAEIELLSTT